MEIQGGWKKANRKWKGIHINRRNNKKKEGRK